MRWCWKRFRDCAMLCPCQEAVAGGGVRPEAAEGEIATDGQKNADLDKTKDCLLFYNKL